MVINMKISIDELKRLANSLLFDMKDEEYKTLQEEFEVILTQMDLIGDIKDINNVEPMVFPYLIQGHELREDEPSDILSKEEVLLNPKETMMDMVKVKKVVG